MKLEFRGKITTIMHDIINRKSKVYLNYGKNEVLLVRPMTKKYEWKRKNEEEIKSGDYIDVLIKKVKRK